MKCSFCGHEFEEERARRRCQACLLRSGCRRVRCPHCGYEMPEELGIQKRLRRWRETMRRRSPSNAAPQPKGPVSLADLRPGESGIVVGLRSEADGPLRKCLALGILPGMAVTLRRRSPSFIFDLGFSQFAVDGGIASAVLVEPRPAASKARAARAPSG